MPNLQLTTLSCRLSLTSLETLRLAQLGHIDRNEHFMGRDCTTYLALFMSVIALAGVSGNSSLVDFSQFNIRWDGGHWRQPIVIGDESKNLPVDNLVLIRVWDNYFLQWVRRLRRVSIILGKYTSIFLRRLVCNTCWIEIYWCSFWLFDYILANTRLQCGPGWKWAWHGGVISFSGWLLNSYKSHRDGSEPF